MRSDHVNLYVLVTGTCTAAPGEVLTTPEVFFEDLGQTPGESVLGQIFGDGPREREKTIWTPHGQDVGREVTGGSTVVLLETGYDGSSNGNLLIDAADHPDLDVLAQSMKKLKRYGGTVGGVARTVGNVVVTHPHLDHFAGIDQFTEFTGMPGLRAQKQRQTRWLVGADETLLDYALAAEDPGESIHAGISGRINGDPVAIRDFYADHRTQGILSSRFTRFVLSLAPHQQDLQLPKGLHFEGYNGHENGQIGTAYWSRGKEIRIFYVEQHESIGEHTKPDAIAKAVVFGGDVLCDHRYVAAANTVGTDGEPDPEARKLAVYGINMFPEATLKRQKFEMGISDAQALLSFTRSFDAVLMPGHGKHVVPNYR